MKTILLIFVFPLSIVSFAQSSIIDVKTVDLLRTQILEDNPNMTFQDLNELTITNQNISKQSGVQHTYVKQYYNGIEIFNAISSIHVMANDRLLQVNHRFEPFLAARVNTTNPGTTAKQALQHLITDQQYTPTSALSVMEAPTTKNQEQLLGNAGISKQPIPAKLVYTKGNNGHLRLAWNLIVQETDSPDMWSYRVDAQTGQLLDQFNMVDNCNHFDGGHDCSAEHAPKGNNHLESPMTTAGMSGSYNVFALPVQHPVDGARSIVVNPHDPVASPFGWHDTDGVAGPEFTTTKGNNIEASDAGTVPGYMPDGGSTLVFDFPLNLNQPIYQNIDASITNAFYCANRLHDAFYHYGFDEASGNFQQNNYGNGGLGGDPLKINVQSTQVTCNANLLSPPDGQIGEMNLFPCNNRDVSFSNTVIAHEYGHAVSRRLVGGPANTACLINQESMTEGWSDYFGILFTMKPTDTDTTGRAIADWMLNLPNGARPYLFTTDTLANPMTYNSIKTAAVPHGLGAVWCNMLWEMTWSLIDDFGFDPDMANGTGGNNIALQLVVEGFRLTACSPGFVDGRDAILAADLALYNGAYECYIWKAFAKRGLGLSAKQNSPNDRSDGLEAFDYPGCLISNNTELDVLNKFEVFPNPGNGQFTVDIEFSDAQEAVFNMVNPLGQQVYSKSLTGTSFDLFVDLSHLSPGVYFAGLLAGEQYEVIRVVVME